LVAKHEIIGECLIELRKLLPLTERHCGPCGSERIGENVERIDPVPAIHLHPLVEDPRRD
jgi:hypothetical protein